MTLETSGVPFSGECPDCERGYTWRFPASEVNEGLADSVWIKPPCECRRATKLEREHKPEGKHE